MVRLNAVPAVSVPGLVTAKLAAVAELTVTARAVGVVRVPSVVVIDWAPAL